VRCNRRTSRAARGDLSRFHSRSSDPRFLQAGEALPGVIARGLAASGCRFALPTVPAVGEAPLENAGPPWPL